MPNPYGDLGQILITFEETVRKVQKDIPQLIDGYVEESPGTSFTFKGVIAPNLHIDEATQGVQLKGDSILYVRTTQQNLPDLELSDVVIDANDYKWRIVDVADYSEHGKIKMYGIVKLVC